MNRNGTHCPECGDRHCPGGALCSTALRPSIAALAEHADRCAFVLNQWAANDKSERRKWRYSKIANEHRVFLVVLGRLGVRTSIHVSASSAADALAQAGQKVTSDPHLLAPPEADR